MNHNVMNCSTQRLTCAITILHSDCSQLLYLPKFITEKHLNNLQNITASVLQPMIHPPVKNFLCTNNLKCLPIQNLYH